MIGAIEFDKTAHIEIQSQRLHRTNFLIIVIFHAFAVIALFHFIWRNLAIFLVFSYIAESLVVGIGYHRLLMHRIFKAKTQSVQLNDDAAAIGAR